MPGHCGEQINQLLPKNTVNQSYFKNPTKQGKKKKPKNPQQDCNPKYAIK